jgi:hypothetical protein
MGSGLVPIKENKSDSGSDFESFDFDILDDDKVMKDIGDFKI